MVLLLLIQLVLVRAIDKFNRLCHHLHQRYYPRKDIMSEPTTESSQAPERNNGIRLARWLINTAISAFLGLVVFSGATVGIIYGGMTTGIDQNRAEINEVKAQITELTISTEKGFHDIVIAMKDNNATLLKNINDFQKETIETAVKNEKDIEYLKEKVKQ